MKGGDGEEWKTRGIKRRRWQGWIGKMKEGKQTQRVTEKEREKE